RLAMPLEGTRPSSAAVARGSSGGAGGLSKQAQGPGCAATGRRLAPLAGPVAHLHDSQRVSSSGCSLAYEGYASLASASAGLDARGLRADSRKSSTEVSVY